MKLTLGIPIFWFLILLLPMSGQDSKVTIQQMGSDKVQELEHTSTIGCTNGGRLQLAGEVRAIDAVPTCADSKCKETLPDKLAVGAYVSSGHFLEVYCTTRAEDEQAKRDLEFCKNNVSNPRPQSDAEMQKQLAEIQQCLKDRTEFRSQKNH